ncbi:MAG TPA: LacI family transcriptional regulator, partial [Chloroflexi bacterium]|nr:LacI family transcriptional regulator [Chloroflexota bacterium]
DPFFSELLAGIGNKAAEHEFDLLVSTRAPGHEELDAYERIVRERRVDGLLVVRTRHRDPRIAYLLDQEFPFVAFGRSDLAGKKVDFSYLDVNGHAGMYQVTQHLINLGHRRIGYISAPLDLWFASHRLAGYQEALAQNDIPFDEHLFTIGELTEQSGYLAAQRLLVHTPYPTAIITCNDLMAFGAISAAEEQGLAVGRDIAITGFDDVPLAEHARPPLTTVHQPIYEIGQRICDLLIQQLLGEIAMPQHIILEPRLVIRQSCGAYHTLNQGK